MFFSGRVEKEGGTSVPSRRAGSSEVPWRTLSLMKKTRNLYRAGFEPQRASPFMKWVKDPQILGEAARV
jgi:hypothetical protein